MVSFWIASSSCEEGKRAVRQLAIRLQNLGWGWYDGFDWTPIANQEKTEKERDENILRDLNGARECDVFIFLNGPWVRSRGANIEFGARLGVGKEVHYIDNGAGESDYFFYTAAQRYSTVEDYLFQ